MDKNEEKSKSRFILLKNAYMPFSPRTEKKRTKWIWTYLFRKRWLCTAIIIEKYLQRRGILQYWPPRRWNLRIISYTRSYNSMKNEYQKYLGTKRWQTGKRYTILMFYLNCAKLFGAFINWSSNEIKRYTPQWKGKRQFL